MQVFVQNLLWLTASTIWPNARSLSATCAAGVGDPGFVPLVWSFGSQTMTRFGRLSAASNCFQFLDELRGAKNIRHIQIPANGVGDE